MSDIDDEHADTWATRTVAAIDLSRTVASLLLVGACIAVAFGIVSAIATYTGTSGLGIDDGMFAVERRMLISQALSTFTAALLPAGLLAAAGAALRLQAARIETLPAQD